MAITQRTRPYETLIRHNTDGSIGAQHKQITEILDDNGTVISATEDGWQCIADANGDGLLTQVLGETTTAALIQIETLTAQVEALQAQLAELGG